METTFSNLTNSHAAEAIGPRLLLVTDPLSAVVQHFWNFYNFPSRRKKDVYLVLYSTTPTQHNEELTAGAAICFLPMAWLAHALVVWNYRQHFPLWNTKALGTCFLLPWNLRRPVGIAMLQLSKRRAPSPPAYSANCQRTKQNLLLHRELQYQQQTASSPGKTTSGFVRAHASQLLKQPLIWKELQTKRARLGRSDVTPTRQPPRSLHIFRTRLGPNVLKLLEFLKKCFFGSTVQLGWETEVLKATGKMLLQPSFTVAENLESFYKLWISDCSSFWTKPLNFWSLARIQIICWLSPWDS